jgi:PAS domain S-box-containing protein
VEKITDAKDKLAVASRSVAGGDHSGPAPSVDALLEGIGEGFFALDPDWRLIAFNHAAEEIFGLPRARLIGRVLWEVSPLIVGSEFDRRYRRVMAERTREEFESYSAMRPDRYHEVRAFPFGAGVGVAFRDITDRQRVTQALRDRELELARVQRIGGIGGLNVDLKDGFRGRRSPEYRHLHGLAPDAADETYQQWLARVHAEDRSEVDQYFLETVASDRLHYQGEYRIVRPSDGEVR